jgi:ABC-type sugar transport system substrate-binding protein
MSSNSGSFDRLWGRRRAVAVAAVIGAAALAGCGGSSSNSTTAGGAGTTGTGSASASADAGGGAVKGKKVVLVACGDVNPWCKVYNQHILDGLKAAGVETTYLQDPFDPVLQVQHLNQAIAQKPDAILVVASDDNSIVPAANKAKQAGIPLINLNGRPADAAVPLLSSSIAADQAALGTYAAQNIIQGMKAQGKTSGNVIAITGTAGTNTTKDRITAFKKELATVPGIKLVEVQDGNWDQVKTAKIAQQLFAKYHNDIQGAYGMADYQAAGIIQSAEQAGLKLGVENKGLIVTGSNCFKVGIDNIKAGKQFGTATQAPGTEGDFVYPLVLKFLGGTEIPKENLNKEARVDKTNLDTWGAPCSLA